MGNCIVVFFSYGAIFAWYAIAPVLLIHVVGLSPVAFGWTNFIVGSLAMSAGAVVNGILVRSLGSEYLLQLGLRIMVLGGILLLGAKFLIGMNIFGIVLPVILFFFGATLVFPNVFSRAMAPFSHIAGYAGSMYAALQLGGAAVLGLVVTKLPTKSQLPLGIIFVFSAILGMIAYRLLAKKQVVSAR